LNQPLLSAGHFVWCAIPERENPARPGPEHVAYVLRLTGDAEGNQSVIAAYTTSKPWVGALPPGVFQIGRDTAATMGQARAFVIDARRLAIVPLTAQWFPRLDQPRTGILGRAPKALRRQIEAAAIELLRRRPETVERLGPVWNPPGRK